MMKKVLIIISVILLVVVVFLSWYLFLPINVSDTGSISSIQCTARGGEIINTLGGNTCPEGTRNIADVHGMRCPCICCIPE